MERSTYTTLAQSAIATGNERSPMPNPNPEPAKLKHSGYIDKGQIGDPYSAHCCCDWQGPLRLTMDEAEADLGKHYALTN
jgi:hypothetical protein